jgi:translation initiation factor 4E
VAAQASSQAVRNALAEYSQASSIPSSSVSSPQLAHSSSSDKDDEEKDDRSSLEDGEIPTEPAGSSTNNPITIFSSQTEFNVKHPLYSTWTLWFDNATKNDKAKNWDELIQQVMQVESVEEFWGSVPCSFDFPSTQGKKKKKN